MFVVCVKVGSFIGMNILFIRMALGFRALRGIPSTGETGMTRGLLLFVSLDAWNDPCTIASLPLSK